MKKFFKVLITILVTAAIIFGGAYLLMIACAHVTWLQSALDICAIIVLGALVAVEVHSKIWDRKKGD